MKLYIKNDEVLNHTDNLYSFVRTYYREGQPATYEDKECTMLNIQCASGHRRSFGDMLDLCKTYFPNMEDKELAKVWRTLYEEKYIEVHWCGDVRKIVSMRDGSGCCWDNCDDIGQDGWSKKSIYDLSQS